MLQTRVIPVLLIHKKGLYKTTKFKQAKYVGDPINAIKIFNEKEVDELILLDIDASKEGREPDYKMIEKVASECFMPLCYGGGVKSIDQIRKIFSLGVEKISLNHCTLTDSRLIEEASAVFGSQSIVGTVNIKKSFFGKHKLYNHVSKKTLSKPIKTFLTELINKGVGEIFINDVDNDGVMEGFNVELLKELSSNLSVPIICCGGAGTLEHCRSVIAQTDASAVSAGSMFVFQGKHRAVLITYPERNKLDLLFKGLR